MVDNFAVVLHGPRDLRYDKWPMPEITNENEVIIKMGCVGICGSDVKLFSAGKCGKDEIEMPMVLGHEGAGVIHKVGSKVSHLKQGDRVAIEPTQPCRQCEFCKVGRYNQCVAPKYCSLDAHGSLCGYYKHVADFCHKIPDNLSLEEAAALQPLAVSMYACIRAGVKIVSKVLVMGAGPIGVLCAMSAKAMGASKVMMTEIVASRLEAAKKIVADHALLVTEDQPEAEIMEKIVNTMGPPDITIDACGSSSAQRTAMMVTKTCGVVLVVGIGNKTVEVPLTETLLREVDIRGIYRILHTYPVALDAVSRGVINLKSLITHHFPAKKTKEAIELAKSGAAMKIIVHVQE